MLSPILSIANDQLKKLGGKKGKRGQLTIVESDSFGTKLIIKKDSPSCQIKYNEESQVLEITHSIAPLKNIKIYNSFSFKNDYNVYQDAIYKGEKNQATVFGLESIDSNGSYFSSRLPQRKYSSQEKCYKGERAYDFTEKVLLLNSSVTIQVLYYCDDFAIDNKQRVNLTCFLK